MMQQVDIDKMLEAPCERFLVDVYNQLLGRDPDVSGAVHYARELQLGLPRICVLAEVRNSSEGRLLAHKRPSNALDRVVNRYLLIRNLPLGRWRWRFLGYRCAHPDRTTDFDWEGWANEYAAEMQERVARPVANFTGVDLFSTPMTDTEFASVHSKLDSLAVALRGALSAMQAKGVPEPTVQALRDAVDAMCFTSPNPSSLSWEARQGLLWFNTNLEQ
jgi:hypothetical protein